MPIDFETATSIWNSIHDSKLAELRADMIELAIRYARIRVDYLLADSIKQNAFGHDRSLCHNALIASCDILARNMAQQGEDASWRAKLGNDRKVIGDFACLLHAILGIASR
jgi:hypothetical protein